MLDSRIKTMNRSAIPDMPECAGAVPENRVALFHPLGVIRQTMDCSLLGLPRRGGHFLVSARGI
jgi:hypothetical protein